VVFAVCFVTTVVPISAVAIGIEKSSSFDSFCSRFNRLTQHPQRDACGIGERIRVFQRNLEQRRL